METAYGLGRGPDRFEEKEVVLIVERLSAGHDSVEELGQFGSLETVHGWSGEGQDGVVPRGALIRPTSQAPSVG
jgi:hypothetical protein